MKSFVENILNILSPICLIVVVHFFFGSSVLANDNPTQLSVLATKVSAANGNWNTNGTWSPVGVPNGSSSITVNHNLTADVSISLNSGSITVNSGRRVVDAAGGPAYNLTLQNASTLDIKGYVSYEGALNVQNTSIVHVHSCDTLIVGTATFSNNTQLIVDSCGVLIVNGNLTMENNITAAVDGAVIVSGNVLAKNSAAVVGAGYMQSSGTMKKSNSAAFYGNSSFDCNTPICIATGGKVGTLPVDMVSCTVTYEDGSVKALWETATEINNDYFTLERSSDGELFEPIVNVVGAGNSSITHSYKCSDDQPLTGKVYYRIKQTDFDGKFQYHCLSSVDVNEMTTVRKDALNIFPVPNPVGQGEQFYIYYDNKVIETGHLVIYSLKGENVLDKMLTADESFIDPSSLPSGAYNIVLTETSFKNAKVLTTKLIIY